GSRELRVVSLKGVEQISRPYRFELLVTGPAIDPATLVGDLLGRRAHLHIARGSDAPRTVHGVVRRVEAEGHSSGQEGGHHYRIRLAPRLHLLRKNRTSRIFQALSVRQIVEQLLGEWRVPSRFSLAGGYAPREYCVQYQESDLHFIERLLAEEGIFYWFEHPDTEDGEELVVFADTASACGPIAGEPELTFQDSLGMVEREPDVRRFRSADRTRPGATLLKEFDFLRPLSDLHAGAGAQAVGHGGGGALSGVGIGGAPGVPGVPDVEPRIADAIPAAAALRGAPDAQALAGAEPTGGPGSGAGLPDADAMVGELVGGLAGNLRPPPAGRLPADASDDARMRIYEHLGEHERIGVDLGRAERHLEQHRAKARIGAGESRCRRLLPGSWLELRQAALESHDGRYTVVRVEHEGHEPEITGGAGATAKRDVYQNRFWCVPADVPCRPRRPRRRLQQVLETATVVGPAGQEIHCDAHGRIRVQFHWDLEGRFDEHSSCWIRAMQPWAGTGWGFQFLPRVGMEVLVLFVGGDLDRPMIVGSAYNAAHPVPFQLPREKTKSGIRTQSSRGGHGYNELSFEDRKGREKVYLRAERDLDEVVGHDHSTGVTANQTLRVGANQTTHVDGAQFAVVEGNRLDRVNGDRVESVGRDHRLSVEGSEIRRVTGEATSEVRGDGTTTVQGNSITHVTGVHSLRVCGPHAVLVGDKDSSTGSQTTVWGDYRVAASTSITLDGISSVTLKCGQSSVQLREDEVVIGSARVRLVGTEAVTAECGGSSLRLDGDVELIGGQAALHSTAASVELGTNAELRGAEVHLGGSGGASAAASSADDQPDTVAVDLTLLDELREPYAGKRYLLVAGGRTFKGATDAQGRVRQEVPPGTASASLTLWVTDEVRRDYALVVAPFPAVSSPRGALLRLRNLGYHGGGVLDDLGDEGRDALRRFQHANGLDPTGELDTATQNKLTELAQA
ncbi:MAG: type VI secretion system tip protein VgrG, partial [Polyangiaceae bacterium]|nr:type VI secretion system tip protein VgrG [Polyangiaceae bacterium]